MDSSLSGERPHVLEEMNNFLSKKDELFAAREKKIQESKEQLKTFEERLLQQANVLKTEKAVLQMEREKFYEEVQQKEEQLKASQAEIDSKWKEVYDYETKCQDAMARLVAEELKEQLSEMKALEEQLKKENDMISDTSNFSALSAIMEELEGVVTVSEEKDKSFLAMFETASKKIFPNSYIVEKKPDRLCIAAGPRELRIFAGENPEIHIVENKKNVKQMDSEVVHLNRLQTEWSFTFKDNHLIAVRQIDEKTAPDVLLRQCKKAISEYFK